MEKEIGVRLQCMYLFPHKVTTFCCSPVIIRDEDENGMDHANFKIKKMVLSITIHLKLSKQHIGNSNILVRYLLRMWLSV